MVLVNASTMFCDGESLGMGAEIGISTDKLDVRGLRRFAVQRVNDAIYRALDFVMPGGEAEQALLKVHIGEPNCATRMQPEYAESSARLLADRGTRGIVSGDTTVAYSGPRGYRENPTDAPRQYLRLAGQHGWSAAGPTGIPFVVLDRPSTASRGTTNSLKRKSGLSWPMRGARLWISSSPEDSRRRTWSSSTPT